MTHEELRSFHEKMCNQRVWLAFKGAVSQQVLVELGTIVKTRLGADNKFKKVFAIFVEMTQNVLHYSAEKEYINNEVDPIGVGLITVTETSDCYRVSSGNLIDATKVEHLKSQCSHINSLNSLELKECYSEKRKLPLAENSKGAGLGLIDIARKSDQPLEYEISQINDQHSFFTLTATVQKGQRG
jgi:hypothetical protein